MREIEFWRHHGAVVAGSNEDSLMTIRHSGPITAKTWLAAGHAAVAAAAAGQALAMVVDLRGALFLSDVAELALTATYPVRTVPLLPAALIVSPAVREAFVGYCWALAGAGVRRVVFTEPEFARGWARRVVLQQSRRRRLAPCDRQPAAYARQHAAALAA